MPVDARLDVPAKLRLEAVQIDDVLDIMEQQTKTSLVFLDACRNNPFARSLSRTAPNRSAVALAGLAQFDSTRGSFIAFSTAPGSVAMDGAGRNSPFASALLRHIGEPGQSINDLMIAVRRDVVSETHDAQRPVGAGIAAGALRVRPARRAAASMPTVKPAGGTQTQVAALERSVGDEPVDRALPRDEYLAPDGDAIREAVKRVYAPSVRIFGSELRQRRHRQAEDRLVRAIFILVAAARARQSRRSRRAARTVPTPSLR